MSEDIREDQERYCALRSRYMLVVSDVCFSRTRDSNCANCKFDRDAILVKLLWEMLDALEDKEEANKVEETKIVAEARRLRC